MSSALRRALAAHAPNLSRACICTIHQGAGFAASGFTSWAGESISGIERLKALPGAARGFSASGAGATEATTPERVVVFGGNGYVGTHISQAALDLGLGVAAVARSGRPGYDTGIWGDQIEWVKADALQPESYRDVLEGASAVVCSIGGFGGYEAMLKVNGETNIRALEAAAMAGVPRAVFISAHVFPFPISTLLKGYVEGKQNAEAALQSLFPDSGVVLRPGFVHGTRMVGSTALPLGLVGEPLEKVLGALPTKSLASLPLAGAAFVPPVSVKKLARVAANAATDKSMPACTLDPWQLHEMSV